MDLSVNDRTLKHDLALKAIQLLDLNPSKKEFAKALSETYCEDEGELTLVEFQSLASLLWEEEDVSKDALTQCFKVLDKDGNGVVSTSEFRNLMMNHGEKLTEQELNDLLDLADQNDDGKMNYSGMFNKKYRIF
jgi:Ca2+-binding EF-hand superfamily protein